MPDKRLADQMMSITVGITNGLDTEEFALFAMRTCIATASFPERLRFLIAVPAEADTSRFRKTFKHEHAEIIFVSNDGLVPNFMRNSFAHCRSLQRLFEQMSTPIGMFCDCDAAFLKHGWDRELGKYLDAATPIIGTAYSNVPIQFLQKISGEPARIYKYQNFPNVVACLFVVERLREIKIDFENLERQANKTTHEVLVSDQEPLLRLAEIPVGGKWMLDTGFDLPLKIKAAGGSGIPINCLQAGSGMVLDLPDHMILEDGHEFPAASEEYQLNGDPIFAHFGKASRRSFGSLEAKHWRDRVKHYIGMEMTNPNGLERQ
jgi:hypothetical protein